MSRPATSGGDRPLENTYWVVPGRFAAGEYPGAWNREEAAGRLRILLRAGLDCFVDLTRSQDGLEPYAGIAAAEAGRLDTGFVHAPHPIVDMGLPRSPQETAAILDAIDEALDDGRNVYVHCWGGIGRTGTVVGCWFVRHGMAGTRLRRRSLGGACDNSCTAPRLPGPPGMAGQIRWGRPVCDGCLCVHRL